MGNTANTSARGYLLIEGWDINIRTDMVTGTRTYIETDKTIAGGVETTVPSIGDSWGEDYEYLTVKSISISPDGMQGCGRKWTVSYDSTPMVSLQTISKEDLPTAIEVSGETVEFTPSGGKWLWKSGGGTDIVSQPMSRTIGRAAIKMSVVVKDVDEFVGKSMTMFNKINDSQFKGFPAGMVRFEGASLTQFIKPSGAKRYRADLTFDVRSITGNFTDGNDGWNWQIRDSTSLPDRLYRSDSPAGTFTYLYSEGDFDELFEETYENEEDDDIVFVPPDQ